MHDHQHDRRDPFRPKSSRIDDDLSDQFTNRAGATGRTDALTPEGVLGLQRAIGNAGVTSMLEDQPSPVHDVIRSSGQALDPEVRTDMEGRLGADLSDVRVHNDDAAHESARSVNAHAYTVGSNIVFQRNQYDPSSHSGRVTLAHELTHVLQQRSGPVEGSSAPGGIKVSDPSDRFEREAAANADRVMSAPAPVQTTPATSSASSGPAVQRAESTEEEEVQGSFVQRAEDSEEEEVQGLFVQRAESPEEEEVQGSFVQRAEAPEEEEETTA